MKARLLPTTLLLLSTLGASAQGYINFSTRVSGIVVGHVYGHAHIGDAEEGQLWGNTASETPAGTQTYVGTLLTGSGYTAQLWYAPGAGQPESSLIPLPGSLTTFRTGATLGGTPVPLVLLVPGVAPGTGVGTFQVRAWDNFGGTVSSYYDAAFNGRSALFEVTDLGDGVLTSPGNLVNFRSFNLTYIPEPGMVSLLTLGGLGWWLFRCRPRQP